MPTLPTYTPQTRVTGNLRRMPEAGSGDAQAAALGGLAESTGKIADVAQRREAQREVSRLTDNLSDAQVEFQRQVEESLQNAQRGDDVVGDISTRMSDRLGKLEEDVTTRQGQQYLQKSAAQLKKHYTQVAMRGQAELQAAFAAEDYSGSLNKWSATIVNDPESLDLTMELHETAVASLAETYDLSAAKQSELRRLGDTTLTRAALRGAIRQSPETALARLQKGAIPHIDPDEQQKWIDTAITAVEQEQKAELKAQEQIEQRAEEEQERIQNETAKTGWELLAQDDLSATWIFENRDNLNKADYKTLLDKVTGDSAVETNADVYADLRVRAGSGEDVTAQARVALSNNQIRVPDFNNILNEIETNAPRSQTPDWYKQGRDYIKGQIGGENANPFEMQVQSRVMDDWTRWATAHPGASVEDAREKYREYANEGLLITGNTVALPVPKFFAGTRAEPDLAATYRALKKSHENDEIEDFEYQRQLRLLRDWKHRIEVQQRAQARPKKTEAP